MNIKLRVIPQTTYWDLVTKGRADSNNDYQYFEPGMAWYCPWLFDPLKFTNKDYVCYKDSIADKDRLSYNYMVNWSFIRPPITVFVTNFTPLSLDQNTKSGDEYVIIGSLPFITCTTHIVTDFNWKGWLKDGVLITN